MSDQRGDGVRIAYPLFQGGGGGETPTSPLQLTFELIDFGTAKGLNRLWHSRLPEIRTGFVKNQPYLCYGAEFDGRWYAVAVWSPPVARSLPQDWTWLELRRLAIAPDAPRNTASRMLGVMARLIRRTRPETARLVSYHDTEVHTGGIYRAAGWVQTRVTAGDTWDGRAKRPGRVTATAAPKSRWEKVLHGQRDDAARPDAGTVAGVRLRRPGVPDRRPEGTVGPAGRDDAPGG